MQRDQAHACTVAESKPDGNNMLQDCVGSEPPGDWAQTPDGKGKRYLHSPSSLQSLLQSVGFTEVMPATHAANLVCLLSFEDLHRSNIAESAGRSTQWWLPLSSSQCPHFTDMMVLIFNENLTYYLAKQMWLIINLLM